MLREALGRSFEDLSLAHGGFIRSSAAWVCGRLRWFGRRRRRDREARESRWQRRQRQRVRHFGRRNLRVRSVGGSSGTAGEAGDGPGEPAARAARTCAASTQEAELTPANLLFVIDKSGSMNCNPPEGDERSTRCARTSRARNIRIVPSKWEVTSDALADALDTLAGQPNVRAGLMLFPERQRVSRGRRAGRRSRRARRLGTLATSATRLDAVTPAGETPIAGATILGYKHLSEAIRAGAIAGNHLRRAAHRRGRNVQSHRSSRSS